MADYDPKWADAISSIESSGDYNQVTPSPGGRAAYGKYQVMGENIPEWTQAALGKRMSPQEFTSNPDAQDAVFKHRFGGYVDQYGTPQDAASAWFTGRPINAQSAQASDKFGTTGASYVNKFNKAMGAADGPTAIDAAMGRTRSPAGSRMALAATDDEEAPPALSAAATLGPGALGADASQVAPPRNWLDLLGTTLMQMAPGIAQDPENKKALVAAATAAQKTTSPGTWSTHFDPATGIATQIGANGQQRQFKYAAPKPDAPKWVSDTGNGNPGYAPTPAEYAAHKDDPPAGPQLLGDASKEGTEYIKSLDPVSQQIIEGWHEGTGQLPSSFKANDPKVQQLMASARKAYPDLDLTRIGERKIFANDAAKSNPASIGGQITNSNTAAQNLNNLADSYIALHNGSGGAVPAFVGRGLNAVSNATADAGRSAAIGSLHLHAANASGEVTKVLTGGPGGTGEREIREKRLGNPNYTNEEAAGVLEAEISDLKGKHDQLIDHTKTTMGQAYLDKHPEIEKNFEAQHATLREKIAQLRGATSADTKPAEGTFTASGKDVPWSFKKQ